MLFRSNWLGLVIGSIGVVYGDIGTSPLYALRESLSHSVKADRLTEEAVIGSISLLIFALAFTVTIKYVLFLMRADNRGEGGTLSLMALAQSALGGNSKFVFLMGVAGAALFSGDAIITPAISVMSAIEGLELVTDRLKEFVAPITITILVTLFWVQSHGTARVAAFFGPIMIIFFLTIAALGAFHIPDAPQILTAFDPREGISFLAQNGWLGFAILGSVFLGVTGAEALYADMGHFGRFPIQFAWLSFILPALLLNYLGQGALILSHPEAVSNPFFLLAPDWALLPLVILSTVATVIASQAVITGAFSIVRQAIQLGLLPRLEITHTSATQEGQIYIGRINRLLLLGVLLLVIAFKSSSALASAYGIAVTGTMVVTTLLAFVVVWRKWGWPLWATIPVIVAFLAVNMAFLAANLMKIVDGGQNYQIGDTIEFFNILGGYGVGALGNVTNVDMSKSYAVFCLKKDQMPGHIIGGAGYDINYLPIANVRSSTGNGANIIVTNILGTGASEIAITSSIGSIERIVILNKGVNYDNNTRIDLSQSGDGKAQATFSVIEGVYSYPGRFLNDDGQVSAYNFLEDRDY